MPSKCYDRLYRRWTLTFSIDRVASIVRIFDESKSRSREFKVPPRKE